MMLTALTAASLLAVAYVMACRLHKMRRGRTHAYIAAQHGALGFASFAAALALVVWPQAVGLLLACGVLAFFLASRHRWSAAPDETSKPGEFDVLPREVPPWL